MSCKTATDLYFMRYGLDEMLFVEGLESRGWSRGARVGGLGGT